MKDIPAAIEAAIREKGLTYRALGEQLGYTGETARITISYWASGKRAVPLDKIRPLAAALGLTVDDLVP